MKEKPYTFIIVFILMGIVGWIAYDSGKKAAEECPPCEPELITYVNPLYEADTMFMKYREDYVTYQVWKRTIETQNPPRQKHRSDGF